MLFVSTLLDSYQRTNFMDAPLREETALRNSRYRTLCPTRYEGGITESLLESLAAFQELRDEIFEQRVRSSRPDIICKKCVLGNFTKFTGKHLRRSLYFNKVAGLYKIETLPQVFSCDFCKIFKNNFTYRTPPVAASEE